MTSTREQGAILWFREDLQQGAVQTDSGRFLRFCQTKLSKEFELGERVDVFLHPEAAARGQVVVAPLPPPKSFVTIEQFTVSSAVRALEAGQEAAPAAKTDRAIRRQARAAPTRRRNKNQPPRKAPGEALDRNTPVNHPQHGQGFVVMSTSRVARVSFGGRERQVRVAELELLDR